MLASGISPFARALARASMLDVSREGGWRFSKSSTNSGRAAVTSSSSAAMSSFMKMLPSITRFSMFSTDQAQFADNQRTHHPTTSLEGMESAPDFRERRAVVVLT